MDTYAPSTEHKWLEKACMRCSTSGLVAKSNVAIVGPRVRFSAGAFCNTFAPPCIPRIKIPSPFVTLFYIPHNIHTRPSAQNQLPSYLATSILHPISYILHPISCIFVEAASHWLTLKTLTQWKSLLDTSTNDNNRFITTVRVILAKQHLKRASTSPNSLSCNCLVGPCEECHSNKPVLGENLQFNPKLILFCNI